MELKKYLDRYINLNPTLIGVDELARPFEGMSKKRRNKARRTIKPINIFTGLGMNINVENNPRIFGLANGRTFVETNWEGKLLFIEAQKFLGEFPAVPEVVLSGICMFSASGIVAIGDDGNLYPILDTNNPPSCNSISNILYLPKLSLYEEVSLDYLAHLLRIFVSQEPSPVVRFHIPDEEYFLFFYELYNQGKISEEQLIRAYQLLRERGELLWAEFIRRFGGPTENIVRVSPLAGLSEELLQGKSITEWRSTIGENGNQYAPLWKKISDSRPDILTDFKELSHMSYIVAYLKGLEKGRVLAIEKAEEFPIGLKTKDLVQRGSVGDIGTVSFGGIYVLDPFISPDLEEWIDLYFYPNPKNLMSLPDYLLEYEQL